MMLPTIETISPNSANHQYSGRDARPSKVAYLRRQVLTASAKPMRSLLLASGARNYRRIQRQWPATTRHRCRELQPLRPGPVRELDGVEAAVAVGVPDLVVRNVERRRRHRVGTARQRQRIGCRLVEVRDLTRMQRVGDVEHT